MNRLTSLIVTLSFVVTISAQQPETKTAGADQANVAKAAATSAPISECGCELPIPDVVASVNGVKITNQDLSAEAQKQAVQLREQVVTARRRELELQINSLMLEAEAKRLKLTSYQLLKKEVVDKIIDPTEAEAQAFYNEKKAEIKGDFPAVKDQIVAYLREQRQREQARKFADQLRAASTVQVMVAEPRPPASSADRGRLLATVNGQRITSADIEDSLAPLIFSVQQQTYGILKQDLDVKINDILLSDEAQKRQVTTRALVETEVDRKVPAITEAQALAFYNENKARIQGDFATVKDDVIEYLKEQEAQRLRVAFAVRLREAAPVQMFLKPPVAPQLKISTDDQPSKGSETAAVTLIEFADFQCPSCAQVQPIVDKLLQDYGERLRVVVREFPLTRHKNAQKAAEAAEAARAQGKYWEYAALLYANQSALETNQLKEYASRVGLDRARFDAALDAGSFTESVMRDMRDGDRAGVGDTPAFFVNGRRVTEISYESLKAAIESALKGPVQ